jgi:hypothetical protein
MSDASERPTGTQGPLKYAPRAVRDGDLARDRSAVPATNKVPSRTEVESDADEIERLFPLRDMRAPVPPAPPERESSPVIRNIVLPSLAAIASALLVFAFYSGKLDFSRTTSAPAPAVPAPASGSIADNPA